MRIIVVDYFFTSLQTQLHIWDSTLRYEIPTLATMEEIFPPYGGEDLRIMWVVGVGSPTYKIYNPEFQDHFVLFKFAEQSMGFLPTQGEVFPVESIKLSKSGVVTPLDHSLFNKHLPFETGRYQWQTKTVPQASG